jgi:hypothetical protein
MKNIYWSFLGSDVHLSDIRCWDADFVGGQKLDVAGAESHGIAAAVELGIVQLRVAVGLCPFAETETVMESHPTKITESGQVRVGAADMW